MRGLSLTRLPGNSGVMSLTRQNYAGPLDLVPGAAAAYGLRRLRFGYTGPAIRVRRSSDNTEADIGFDGAGDLNTAALLAHVGAGNGFVTTWYDQSGNARNLLQATAANQPSIVSAGVAITDSARPALQFDGTNDVLSSASAFINSTVASSAMTLASVTGGTNVSFGWTGNTQNGGGAVPRLYFQRNQFAYNNNATPIFVPVSGTQTLTFRHDGVTTTSAFRNGTSMGTATEPVLGSFAGGFLSVPLFAGGVAQAGFASEAILFATALSTADRQTLERNQGTYYGISVA